MRSKGIMKSSFRVMQISFILVILLLGAAAGFGVFYADTGKPYPVMNQYGEEVIIYGAGIYAHDSLFKAPILIGTDITMLLFVVPLAVVTLIKSRKQAEIFSKIDIFAISGVILYYAVSIAMGVTYNRLHLIYILLVAASFYLFFYLLLHMQRIDAASYRPVCTFAITRGMRIFLICAGISLFVAWLPDIISSLISGSSLSLIEIYTTEITYVLDMGIISPLMFLVLYLLNKNCFLGFILFRMLLRICEIVGIMLPIQTICQLRMGITIPLPAFLMKVLIFIVLALSALYFDISLQRKTDFSVV